MTDGNSNLQSLPWTGERYLPDIHGSVELEHLHRYLFAGQLTAGKRVLDIASGEGYGSAMLARSAEHVTGVDISSEAVLHAKAKYRADNLEFLEGSCAAIPLPDACVDIVVSFETIEHHDEHDAMMLEIIRVLKPNGLLVISCPDKLEYTDKPAYNNEYHVKELYRDEFEQLLKSHFARHNVFGQRAAYGSLILQENKSCLSETYNLADSVMEPIPGLSNSIYLIAIATNGTIPDVKVGLLDQDLLSIKEITERDTWILSLSQTVDSLIIDRDSHKAMVEQLQISLENSARAHEENVVQVHEVIADRDFYKTEVALLQKSLEQLKNERDAVVLSLSQTVDSLVMDRDFHKAEVALLQKSLEQLKNERDAVVLSLNQTVDSLIMDRDSHKAMVEQLQISLENTTRAYEENVAQLHEVIADRDFHKAEVALLQKSLEQLKNERDASVLSLNQTVDSLIMDRDSHKAMVEQLQISLEKTTYAHEENIAQLHDVVADRDCHIDKLFKSKSWRLTSPLRWLSGVFSKINNVCYSCIKAKLRLKSTRITETDINTKVEFNIPIENNNTKFRILLVSYFCPTRAHAGGLRILDIYALIRHQCPHVQIDLFTFHRPSIDWSLDDVNALFDNVYLSPVEELTPETLTAIRGSLLHYDVIDLQFHQSAYQIDAFRRMGSKIIFTPMESLAKVAFINLQTNFFPINKSRLHKVAASLRMAVEEIRFSLKADEVVCVSRSDASFLRAVTFSRKILGVDTGVSQFEFAEAIAPGFVCASAKSRRCNILYVAYFGSETNVSALRWYLDNVHPIVKASVPDYVLTVVGRGDLSAFSNDQDKSIEFVGEVVAIAPYIQEARVGIAPALSGSGLRGKVNQYAIFGVPSVVSPIAHKGLVYEDSENIFVAEKPETFATQCIRLLTDFELNDRMGQAAREVCLATYSWQSKWPTISKIYNLGNEEVVRAQPKVTALVPSYNHGRYIQERIESIINQTYSNIELIVIDDCSDDNSHQVISELQARYGFQYIRNEKNSGTPFAAWERICTLGTGDYIWVCESDDVAEPCFLEKAVVRMVEEPNAVLFYSNSHIINELSEVIGHTNEYFHDIWKEKRWDAEFVADGHDELLQFQLRGQTVPNMSSALIKTSAFKAAFTPFLKRLRLTGDWLFIGDVMQHGRVIFSPDTLSRFRKHEVTSRARVKSARSQAEFILTKYRMFRQAGQPIGQFATFMASDVIRFLYEPASWWEVTKALIQVSWIDSIKFTGLLFVSTCKNTSIISKFRERYKHAKGFNNI